MSPLYIKRYFCGPIDIRTDCQSLRYIFYFQEICRVQKGQIKSRAERVCILEYCRVIVGIDNSDRSATAYGRETVYCLNCLWNKTFWATAIRLKSYELEID